MPKGNKNRSVGGMLAKGEENPDRNRKDFYPTPAEATLTLLANEEFPGLIWECASGKGHITVVLEAAKLEVLSTDLIADEHEFGTKLDFLATTELPPNVKNIVTNPPYNLMTEFIIHAVGLMPEKVALHVPLQNLMQTGRKHVFDDQTGYPHRTYVFVPSLNVDLHLNNKPERSVFAHCWAIWLPKEEHVFETRLTMVDWREFRLRAQPRLFE